MQRPFPAYQGDEPFVFVSYAHKDAKRIYPLLVGLRDAGINIWYDEGIEPGSRWRDELAKAIETCACLLFFASETSVVSDNCNKEISFALDKGRTVALAYLEEAKLPQGLEFSLGDTQAIRASHYKPQQFAEKLLALVQAALTGSTPRAGFANHPPVGSSNRSAMMSRLLLVVLALCVLIGLWFGYGQWSQEVSKPTGPPVVAVTKFRNLTTEPANDWLGDGLAHMVRDKLSSSRHLQVVSDARWSGLQRLAGDDPLADAGKDAGIQYLVSGEIFSSPDGLVLSARMTQLHDGIDLAARSFRGLTQESLINHAEQLALVVKQGLRVPSEAQIESLSADFQVTNLGAYESYVAGLHFYNAFDYDKAELAMETALALEPSYAMAAYRAANIQASAGRLTEARNTLSALPDDASKTPREAAYIRGLEALLAEDNLGAIAIYQELLEQYPYEIEAQQFLAEAYYRNYEDAKGIQVLRALSRQEPENVHVWSALGFMLSSIEQLDEARAALARYQQLAPSRPNPWELLGSLEMKAGNLAEAEAHFAKAIAIDPSFSRAQQGQARLEISRGAFAAAEPRLTAIVDNENKAPRDRVEAAFDLVAMYQATGRYVRVSTVLAKVEPLLEEWVTLARSEQGLASLRMGDVDSAEQHFADALSYEFPGYRPTRFLFCLGLAQIARQDAELLGATLLKMADLPKNDAGGKLEEKAAAYLLGLNALQNADYAAALQNFRVATDAEGYEYRIYRVGLAEALFRTGDLETALAEAEKAAGSGLASWAGEPRLDLEVDRRIAQALAIRILKAQGELELAAQREEAFQQRWGLKPDTASVLFRVTQG